MGSKENVEIKLWEAIQILAEGSGRIQERMERAALNLTAIFLPASGDLPAEDQKDIEAIISSMKRGIDAGICHLNDEEACDIAKKILAFYSRMCAEQ